MQKMILRVITLCAMLATLQACTPATHSGIDVNAAYETSGIVAMKPYTRTIFSSSNF